MSAARPYKCTTMMARVRGVMRLAISAAEILKVSGSMSANTGAAPSALTALPVATNVKGGRITSSPAATPTDRSAKINASVPEATPTPWATPQSSAISDSRAAPSFPSTNRCEAITLVTASRISSPIAAYCAARSICGIASNSDMMCRGELIALRPQFSIRQPYFAARAELLSKCGFRTAGFLSAPGGKAIPDWREAPPSVLRG